MQNLMIKKLLGLLTRHAIGVAGGALMAIGISESCAAELTNHVSVWIAGGGLAAFATGWSITEKKSRV